MASLTGLFRRGGSYYLRIVLPEGHPLKNRYRNGRWVQTLGACSHREAVHHGTRKRAEVLHGLPALAAPAPAPTQQCPAQDSQQRLRDVFNLWKAAKVCSADSVSACERSLALFEAQSGNPPVQQITRAQGDAFRAHLLKLDLSSKTKHDRMTWAKSLLKYAYRDLELIPRNPWEGLDVQYVTERRRSPWTVGQLKALFELPLFTAYELPTHWKAGGAAAYWVPLIGLYTGARIGELCQLRVEDIERDNTGAFIKISEEAPGATVKTEAGLRSVPVHSELVRLGFLDYVADMQKAGVGFLADERHRCC